MSTLKKFCGKYYFVGVQNNCILLDTTTGKLTVCDKTQTVNPDSRFNLYGDINGWCYFQAMNGKYVGYDSVNGYAAVKESQEEADLFCFADGQHIYQTLTSGETCYWNVVDKTLVSFIKKESAEVPASADLSRKQITKGLDMIKSSGAITCDLTWVDLSGEEIPSCNFGGATLINANVSQCNIQYANFSGSATVAEYADFSGAKLTQALFMGANFTRADFTKADLTSASAQNTNFKESIFNRAILVEFNAMNAECSNTSFISADCNQASFQRVNFQGANLSNANLSSAMLYGNCFSDVDFTGANIPNVNFISCTVNENTVFNHANMKKCNFSQMNLRNISMCYANLTEALFDGADMSFGDFSYANFTKASLKGTVQLVGASLANSILQEADFTNAQLGAKKSDNLEKNSEDLSVSLENAADLTGAYMPNAIFKEANLYGVNMAGINWYGAKASAENAELQLVNFTNANLATMNFAQARLYGCNFDYANLISTNFRKANLTSGAGGKRVSFAYANIQGADFMDSEIVDTVFTNAAIALNDGPYFTLQYDNLNDLMKLLNQNGPVPDSLRSQFEQKGLPLGQDATLELYFTNCYWYINNPSNLQYVKYTLYLAGDVIKVGGGTIGVHLFSIDNVAAESITSLNKGMISDTIKKEFANKGYELIAKVSIKANSILDKKWYLDNATHDKTKIQKGYLEFVIKTIENSSDNTYRLYVYGSTLATVKVTEDNTLQQETTYLATTKIIQNLMKEDTVCPSGQKVSILTDSRKNVRMTWEDALTANTLPKEPTCIPDPFHWC